MKRLLENTLTTWVWFCVLGVLALLALFFVGTAVAALTGEPAADAGSVDTAAALPRLLTLLGFTVSTALGAVCLALPLSLALCVLAAVTTNRRIAGMLQRFCYTYSGIPAVVLGFMAMRYVAPGFHSEWLGLTLSLTFIALPRMSAELTRFSLKSQPLLTAAQCLGGDRYTAALKIILPSLKGEIGQTFFRALSAALSEGVAVALILLAFQSPLPTLALAILQALGITTGEVAPWTALSCTAALFLPLLLVWILEHILRRRWES